MSDQLRPKTAKKQGTPISPDMLEALKANDQEAWSKLFQELSPKLLRYATKRLDNVRNPDDVVQRAWMWCWMAIVDSDKTELYRSYFYAAVYRAALPKRKGRIKPDDLVRALEQGDEEAWHTLKAELLPKLIAYARTLLAKPKHAEAVVEEVWRVFRKAFVGSGRTKLYRSEFYLAVYVAIRGRGPRRPASLDQPREGDPGGLPLLNTIGEAGATWLLLLRWPLEWFMNDLDELERAVIECRFFLGMTRRETAEQLGLKIERGSKAGQPSEEKVRYAEECALDKMRRMIARELGDGDR